MAILLNPRVPTRSVSARLARLTRLTPIVASATFAIVPLLYGLLLSCTGDATPRTQTCPTTAQSVMFDVNGSCGDLQLHTITIDSMPGLCALQITGIGRTVGLPQHGTFTGSAAASHYQIAAGNWSLHGVSADPQADPSTTDCIAGPADGQGRITVDCNLNDCVPSGEDNGYSCTQASCVAHLAPHVGATDAGVDAGAD